jgi:myo-inositol-1(or 4)-monophosphatase
VSLDIDIEFVKGLVVQAGKRALEQSENLHFDIKPDKSIVTTADREAEVFLETSLTARYPQFAFFGEEYGFRGPEGAPVWICDPIDGTTGYFHGLPTWGVSLGLVVEGIPTLGVLYLPCTDELFWGERGQGAFCNGVPLRIKDSGEIAPSDIVCVNSGIIRQVDLSTVPGSIFRLGSIALEVAYTARGKIAATVGGGEDIKDVAAALVCLFEAGCDFRYLTGGAVDLTQFSAIDGSNTRRGEPVLYGPPRICDLLQEQIKFL